MANAAQWRLFDDAISRAQATLVNFQHKLKLASYWEMEVPLPLMECAYRLVFHRYMPMPIHTTGLEKGNHLSIY